MTKVGQIFDDADILQSGLAVLFSGSRFIMSLLVKIAAIGTLSPNVTTLSLRLCAYSIARGKDLETALPLSVMV